MSNGKIIIDTVLTVTEALTSSKSVQKFLFGEYSDGSPRTLPDALNDELYSPKQKKNKENIKHHKKKNKKKNKKKKKNKSFTL